MLFELEKSTYLNLNAKFTYSELAHIFDEIKDCELGYELTWQSRKDFASLAR